MTRARRAPSAMGAALAALVTWSATSAQADNKECSAAYVEAQKLKKDGSLKDARQQLLVCGKASCLAAVKKDCVAWLDEVNAAMPSVVIEATGPDGRETFDVKVTVDGEVIAEKLGTGSLEVDPGVHQFRFESGDLPPIEQEVILREGQKHKPVQVSFAKKAEAAPPKSEAPPATPDEPEAPEKPDRTLAYVLGGVGVVAVGAATALWISAESSRGDLDDSGCAPGCAEDDVDSIRTRRIIGDVALGVGVAAIAVGVYFFIEPPGGGKKKQAKGLAPTVGVGPNGATASVSGRF